ncbi:uncharacterized protein LOC111695729 [Eurytemora carolleeae]|uniref:uncharacterized protein LOC111695729 n=1 Tax=Eurytemora carolleeae TaxID=1294199 RepID=UPI000C787C7D|nr:uncharacterized protein LOC111695729 [Eurytemora carolleeae]|eukprot:XP_023320920.1 uncharacterized protein LOC111695729 [Eurytemora affinis]
MEQANEGPGEVRDPILNARDRLFHSLFFRLSLAYARSCPRQVRRLVECLILVKAVMCMCMLVYIHLVYTRQPVQCLEHLADVWPRDGVLRVEIQRGGPYPGYDINTSYEKERRLALRQRELDNLGSLFSIITGDLVFAELLNSEHEEEEPGAEESQVEEVQLGDTNLTEPGYEEILKSGLITNSSDQDEKISTLTSTLDHMKDRLHSLQEVLKEKDLTDERLDSISEYGQDIGAQASKLKTVIVNMTDELSGEEEKPVLDQKSDLEKLSRVVWPDDGYIVEYSLEIGFLRLSPATRQKLNIPVHIEILDPNTNTCFGDSFSKFILENLLGYEDVLMSSVKSLADKENNKGFLRNVVTGAQYHFVSKWSSVSSYVPAALVMIVFTISISMLLRYSQHQIFVFIIDLLQMLELNTNITFPAAPLLTVILALVGMEAIMSEFFEDTTTAFYIILLVWLCDQYDSVCCHTPITKRYWLRFFYLYHTAFYAYHYRFSGQYSGLALLTMWLFTQHSMLYFFHHYELPVILQQAQIRDILIRNNGQMPINVTLNNNNNNNVNTNNNNVMNNNMNGVRRLLRPRMRGFTLGGFRFRFGIVFHALQHPVQAPAPAAAPTTPPAPRENSPENNPDPEPGTEPDPAVVRRYVAEVSASAMSVEQLAREGRLDLEQSREQAAQEAEQWSREEAESVEEEDEVEQEPSHDNNEITQPGSSPGETDPDQKEKGSIETNHSTETNITSSSDTTESGREALNPADLQEIRSNLQDAAREASDLLRDVQY